MAWLRRCAFLTLVVFGLSVAVPSQVVVQGGGFPLGWVGDLFRLPQAWAVVAGLPRQGHGAHPGLSGYVPASATTANGGSGSAPKKVARGLDGYRPHDASSGKTKTAPVRRGYVAGSSERQASKSSATMDQYANADGSTTRVFSTGRMNYRAADGSWHQIDPTLVLGASNRWMMKANFIRVSFAGSVAAPSAKVAQSSAEASATATAGADPLASVALPSGDSVGYDLSGAAAVTPAVTGSTATYLSILPSTDLELQSYASGIKETLVLDTPAAGNKWVFPLHLSDGLSPRMTADGSVEVVDASGTRQAWFPRGSMTDSKFDPLTGDMMHSSAVTMSLTTLDGGPALTVVADRAWLDDAARVYPVRVDPTLATYDTGDAYVDNDSSTDAGDQAGNNLAIGTYDGGTTKARSYLNFGYFDDQVNGGHITAANLQVYLTWQYSCGTARPFYVYPATEAWSSTTLATSSYPGPSIASSSIGSLTVTVPGAACTNTGGDRSVGVWETVPLSVSALNGWTSNSAPYGLALVSSVTDSYAWKRFTSERYGSGAYAPKLNLTVTPDVVPQVDTRYPANNTTVETLTPQLVTRAHDPDSWPNTGLTYTYKVYNAAGTVIVNSGALTTAAWQVPAGKLAWNGTYYYTVTVSDKLHAAAESSAYAFATPVPQPRLTADLAQNTGAGFDPNNGNYTTSVTDAQVAGVGPVLEISRSYNSLDTRRSGAFGQGWSSTLDTKATEKYDTTGAVQTVVVTYPNGSEVAFGRNSDGTFTAPSGRYATLTAQISSGTVTGYTLTDKNATQYVFARSAGSGVFKITSIVDANGRPLTFAYASATGLISTVTNAAGRTLTLTWAASSSPTVGAAHVASVTTDALAAGGTGYTWNYTYDTYDRLTTVCPPATSTACTVYTWDNWNNQYADATLNLNPYSFWRLNEASGSSAVSSVLTNAGVDNGTYKNVTLGGTAPLANSSSTSATFNGTSSYVQLPGKLVNDGSYESLSMWFKTSTPGGVLFSYSGGSITAGTTSGNYTPSLYVDKNGYLRGEFWQGATTPMKSTSVVTNGAWHHVVLSGAGGTQAMYLDGVAQGSPLSGTIGLYQTTGSANEYVGAGFVGGGWPDLADTGASPAVARYFTGSIADVAFSTKPMTAADVSALYGVATNSSSVIQKVTSPAGRVVAQVAVSAVSGQVTSVTDENGGVWTMGTPQIAGSSDVYEASVLGAKPTNYWRLGETGGDVTDAVNEVAGDTASYSAVTLGASGPFSDATAAAFDGASSNVVLPSTVAPAGASSVGLWFNTTATGDVLLGSQAGALGDSTAPGLPTLWISADGKLRGLSPSTTPTGPLRSGIDGKCVDDASSSTTNGAHIQLYDCNGSSAQNLTWNTDNSVRVLGKCLDVTSSGTANGTKVQLYTCNASTAQTWVPYNGGLQNTNSGKCLDDPGSTTTNATQLQIYTCNGSTAQKWTLSLASSAAVNDGNWHQAVLTSSGTAQSLYVDDVKVASTTGTVALTPGSQPYAYLGAGFTGTGWSGLTASTTAYYTGSLAEAAFYPSELAAAQVDAQWSASKQTVPVAVTTVDATVKTITMPVKTVTVTDPGGHTISYAYDLINNREVAETDALGNTSRYGYDTGGFSSLLYDANGIRTQRVKDARGNTIQQITCQHQSANLCSSTYYDYYLNSSNPVDPRNDVMTASRGGMSSSATDTTYQTTYTLDAKGNPTTATDPLGGVTATSYTDGTSVAAADSGYAPAGLPYKITNAAGGVQSVVYDANGDIAKTVSPAGEVRTYTYDQLGRKLTETVTTSSFPNGRTSSFTYDPQGRLLTETDTPVTNRVTGAVHTPVITNVYDADGNLTSQTTSDATGGDVTRTESVTYNDNGQKASQTDAVGKTTSFTYDAYGHTVTETDTDGVVTAFNVDADGQLLSETTKNFTGDPNNPSSPVDVVTESHQYDPAGRLASTTDAMHWTTAYTYTDDGRVATVTRTDGTSTFVQEQDSYDQAGELLIQVTDNGTTTRTFTYDHAGRRTVTVLDPAGLDRVTTDTYSADDNAVSTAQSVGTGNPLSVTDTMYDAEGRVRARTAYNADPASTPLARWKLNQSTGTSADDSAGNSPGTAAGITWSTAAPTGLGGSAAFAGNAGSRITTTGPVLDTARSYTVSAWVYLTNISNNKAAVSQDGDVRSGFLLGYDQAVDRWRMLVSQSSTVNAAVHSSAAPALNTWTHLSAVYDATGKTVTLYVNGVAQGSTATTSMATSGPLVIGGGKWSGGAADAWPGQVADVQAYQRPLTATQVAAIYGGTAPAAGAGVSRTSNILDEGGLATRTVDPLGNLTDISYDEAQRPAVRTAAAVTAETTAGSVTARPVNYIGYDTFGDPTEAVDSNGNKTTNVYDRAGRRYETHKPTYTTPDGTATINPVTSTVYDTLGRQASTTDALGNVTNYTYDQLGRLAKTVAPDGGVTTVTYDLNGDLLSVTDPTGAVSATTYDFLGRKATSTQAVRQTSSAFTTSYAYDSAGRLQQTTSPAGVTQSQTYDAAGDILTTVNGAGQTTTSAYDGLSRTIRVTQPDGTYRTTAYDMLSRNTGTAAYAAGGGTALTTGSQTYDAAGNVLTSTDGRGAVTSYTYDPTGLVLSEKQPVSSTASIGTSFGYDLNGNRTRYTDGRGTNWFTTYDAWNIQQSQIAPATTSYSTAANSTTTYAYDADGRLTTETLPGGVTQTFGYDATGNLLNQQGSGASAATATRSFTYDQDGRVLSAATSAAGSANATSESFSYDDRGMLLTASGSAGSTTLAYNADGLPTSRTDASGTTSYSYDSHDLLTTVTDALTGTVQSYHYNKLNQVSSINEGSGDIRNFGYDDLHRLTSDQVQTAAGTVVSSIGYGYDANSNLTSKNTTGFGSATANTYTYDQANRLTSWNNGTTTVAYGYDAAGNRTQDGSKVFTYDARDELTNDGTTGYTHTAAGVLSAAGTTTLTCDAYGQQTSDGTVAYTYDAQGRLVRRNDASGSQTVQYSGAGNQLAGDGQFVYSRDPDGGLLAVRAATGTTSTAKLALTDLHTDLIGTLSATDTTLTQTATYDPLGTLVGTRTTLGNLGYQSEYTDPATGKANMAARWYNPATGQFTSKDTYQPDPAADSTAANPYAYTGDDPLTRTDPTGHMFYRNDDGRNGTYWNKQHPGRGKYVPSRQSGVGGWTANDDYREQHRGGTYSAPARHSAGRDGWTANDDYRERHRGGKYSAPVRKSGIGGGTAEDDYRERHRGGTYSTPVYQPEDGSSHSFRPNRTVCDFHTCHILYDDGKGGAPTPLPRCHYKACGPGCDPSTSEVCGILKDIFDHILIDLSMVAPVEGGAAGLGADAAAGSDVAAGEAGVTTRVSRGAKCSFTPTTPVLLSNHNSKPIKDIKVGDRVASLDPVTATARDEPVTQLHDNVDTDMVDLAVADKDGRHIIHTTQNHPFWDVTTQQWTLVNALKHGDQLASTTGQVVHLDHMWFYAEPHHMLNLTIANLHTYYVLAGRVAVLVHNDGGTIIPQVDDPALQNSINALFHGLGNPDQVGDGSALAAANQQALDGELLHGQDHLRSTTQIRSALNNWLTKDIRLKGGRMVPRVRSEGDVKVANSLIQAIDDAQAGKYGGLSNYGLGCGG